MNFLLGDHLGSTSLTTDASGQIVSELRYKAWGEIRYASGDTSTKYQFTGQYSYASEFGLHFYNARWYDSSLGRFTQADTIIPGAGNPQAWDRYSYVLNNPLRYTDPTGHMVACEDGDTCEHDYPASAPGGGNGGGGGSGGSGSGGGGNCNNDPDCRGGGGLGGDDGGSSLEETNSGIGSDHHLRIFL